MTTVDIEQLDWQKMDDLIPAVIQDHFSAQVLMLGYVSKDSLQLTLTGKKVTFFSRSKQRLWVKGETSGNYLHVVDVTADCDQDSVLILVKPEGPTCHLGNISCFGDASTPHYATIAKLENIITERATASAEESYTAKLLQGDIKRTAQKVGEEGVEVSLAAATGDTDEFKSECADLLYHLLVLLRQMDVSLKDVLAVLAQRMK